MPSADLDPTRYTTDSASPRGFEQVFIHEGRGGVPLLVVHGWPETRRIWWRVVGPLAAAGFEVVAPDLRGFGDSGLGPDGFHDVVSHSLDLHALVHDHLGHDRIVVAGGDLGGPVIQDLTLRFPGFVERMVLFNSPLPWNREKYEGLRTRSPRGTRDYFERQGTDPDGLAAELATGEQRRRYIATFYTSRYWAHPDAFSPEDVDFHTEPFADAAHLRASFGGYESAYAADKRVDTPAFVAQFENPTPTLLLYGPSDHVIMPDFDRMAERVFPERVGPFLLRDCGHFVPWEAAQRFVGATRTFCGDRLHR